MLVKKSAYSIEPNTLTLTLPSHPKYLSVVRAMVTQVAANAGFSDIQTKDIALAVDEACTNVIKHVYRGNSRKPLVFNMTIAPKKLEIKIRDFGRKIDPRKIKPRPLNEIRPGGLGVFFIKRIMDEVHYDTSHRVGTELKLVKYLK
jgi:anti-sigma regulatory factor (Ser/Thr protein kinase)